MSNNYVSSILHDYNTSILPKFIIIDRNIDIIDSNPRHPSQNEGKELIAFLEVALKIRKEMFLARLT